MKLTVGSLFSGIGGFDLGFQRAGFEIKFQVEIDPWCRRVLAKHWPDVRRHDDVKTFPPAGDWGVDCIIGGFPCQDLSLAGRRAGLDGDESGLWWEYARVIRLLRPRYVVVENVPGILSPTEPGRPAPIGCVLGELARLGFDAEWDRIPAASVGAPHLRWRIFIVARRGRGNVPDSEGRWSGQCWREQFAAYCESQRNLFWPNAEPPVCGVADGVPNRLDRLRGLGNAVVPQVAEWIGRRLMDVMTGEQADR